MPQTLYEVMWIFLIYSFIGWCTEVAYAAVVEGVFVNRGFFNGPYCPIYGFGVLIVVFILYPLKENMLFLFIGSLLMTTALEFIAGFLLEKVFHNQWWDYSDKPFNIKGYICLEFSIIWGLACTFVLTAIHPMIFGLIKIVPKIVGIIVLTILMVIFAADLVVTVMTIFKLNKRLQVMDQMARQIHKLSDEIGESIFDNVNGVKEKSGEFQENHPELISKINETKEDLMDLPGEAKTKIIETANAAKNKITETKDSAVNMIEVNIAETKDNRELKKKEREELTHKYIEMLENKNFGFKRLMKAFPDMKSKEENETLEKFKNYFNIKTRTGRKNDSNN